MSGTTNEPSRSTSDLIDELGDGLGSCEIQFRQFGGLTAFAGPISTVRCHEDNALMRSRLEEPGTGRVLVVDGGGSLRVALLGDMIATIAMENGWAGLVVWGAVRDVEALATLPIGIKALGSNPCKSRKSGAGALDVPVSFGGVTFRPGEHLVSDADGIVVPASPIG